MKVENTDKIVCIIPARYASTRLPGKPLVQINGLPLVMWVYRRACESNAFDQVLVATDDQRIFDTVSRYGATAVMTAVKHTSGTDRVFEALSRQCGSEYKFVVNLQGDEPLIPLKLLQTFAQNLPRLDSNSLLTCVSNATIEETKDPNVVKVVLSENNQALYFSRASIPFVRDREAGQWYKHTGIYGFTRESIETFCALPQGKLEQMEKLEQLRALERGMKIYCIIEEYDNIISIDTKDDLDAFRRLVAASE